MEGKMKYFIILILSILIAACASDKYIINEKLIPVPIPDAEDTIRVNSKTDTLIIAEHIHLTDTIAIIKYYPQKEKIYYKIKQDTIYIPNTDTILIEKPPPPQRDYTPYILFTILIMIILIAFLKR